MIEAIEEIRRFDKELAPLEWSEGLGRAAGEHVGDTGGLGMVGHRGTDGSTSSVRIRRHGKANGSGENISYGRSMAIDALMQLFIDDGTVSRGHRARRRNGVARGRRTCAARHRPTSCGRAKAAAWEPQGRAKGPSASYGVSGRRRE